MVSLVLFEFFFFSLEHIKNYMRLARFRRFFPEPIFATLLLCTLSR